MLWTAPITLVLPVYFQYRVLQGAQGTSSCLETAFLRSQTIIIPALALRWFQSLGAANERHFYAHVRWWNIQHLVVTWYHRGFLAINYSVCSAGYAILLWRSRSVET
jgi:hypothetical protein